MRSRIFKLEIFLIAFAILGAPNHAHADKETPRIKACILRFAEIVNGRKSKPETVETIHADDVFDVAKFEALEKEKPVYPSSESLATRHYRLSEESKHAPIDSISNVREIPGVQLMLSGTGFHEALQGEFNGQHVFIKISTLPVVGKAKFERRKIEHFTNEVAWIKRLESLEIGPRFYGLTEKNGKRGLVTDFIDGIQVGLIPSVEKLPANFHATPKLVESLEKMKAILEREGIFPKDLQLRMTSERAFIVDPEFFYPTENRGEIEYARKCLDELIADAKSHL